MARRGWRILAWAWLVIAPSCAHDALITCGDELCALDSTCVADACVTNAQLSTCAGQPDDQACDAVPNGHCYLDPAAAVPVCTATICGDGKLEFGELCDDGNNAGGDGCSADCQGRFEAMQTPTALSLLGAWTTGPTDAWAVGVGGTMLHFDGTAWSSVETSALSGVDLRTVWSSGSDDVWIAGDASSSETAVLAHCSARCADGSDASWSTVANNLFSISSISGDGLGHAYVSGRTVANVTEICLANGGGCIPGANEGSARGCVGIGGNMSSLWRTGDALFAAGDPGVCQLQSDGRWKNVVPGPGSRTAQISGDADVLYELTGSPAMVAAAPIAAPANRTFIVVPGDVQAFTDTGSAGLTGFVPAGHTELLVIGSEGVILDYDVEAARWTHLVSPSPLQLMAIAATGPTNVFVVGSSGTILH